MTITFQKKSQQRGLRHYDFMAIESNGLHGILNTINELEARYERAIEGVRNERIRLEVERHTASGDTATKQDLIAMETRIMKAIEKISREAL